MDYGDGRAIIQDEHYMHFSKRNCNFPQPKFAKWWLTQFRRWGMVSGKRRTTMGVAKQVMRGDIYTEAMKEIGVTDRAQDDSGWEMFDGVKFDPARATSRLMPRASPCSLVEDLIRNETVIRL